ncbi:MAG: sigma-70 family RNA polymerase sigma factor [Paraprevotella sp.]|nr:sigma-70 family RNA polymerase sigma factor [Paraprevotella sp.]
MGTRQGDSKEERELIRRVSCGEKASYTGMMNRYGRRVMSLISRMVAEPRDAEELAQDTFVKAFSHINTYDESKASLSTWLLHIAYNETVNHLRRRKPDAVHLDSWMEDLQCGAETDGCLQEDMFSTDDEQRIRLLEDAVELLPAEERILLVLYYYDNLSMQEISQILGQKPSTLTLRLFRLRRKLRGMIEKRINTTIL